ncbi:hypothetical protein M0638_10645 [Roseomonas sp. NAR14]|uniref:Lipoprotein n=1 Tax=Roseomonas acroporae TaxID=2937791 RepID=A0A9X1Y829_9PROT|nr:hypothetical protein [Roseomonas acroporae]MCK8784840.1 hypothetical protein [Roseomonas acroporae]
MRPRLPVLVCVLLAGACAPVSDARYAHRAQAEFLGLSELDLATCMGAPLRRLKIGEAEILTYEQVSSSTVSVSLPFAGGMSVGGGGNCRANVRLDHGRVTAIRYTGESDTFFTSDSYCAPLVRNCLRHPLMYAPPEPGGAPRPAERSFGPAPDRQPPAAPADAP